MYIRINIIQYNLLVTNYIYISCKLFVRRFVKCFFFHIILFSYIIISHRDLGVFEIIRTRKDLFTENRKHSQQNARYYC